VKRLCEFLRRADIDPLMLLWLALHLLWLAVYWGTR
jgi:hypothetical protein